MRDCTRPPAGAFIGLDLRLAGCSAAIDSLRWYDSTPRLPRTGTDRPNASETRFAVTTIDERTTATRRKPYTGADVLVESLVRHGVEVIFAYPGGASMPMHQALTRFRDRIRTILPRHEQGGIFAAEGYARALTRKPGVVMAATSNPGARRDPGNRAGRRQDGLAADRRHHRPGAEPRHRHRRLPGNPHGRGLPRDHQAPLPGAKREGHGPHRQGGVSRRQHRPARARADRRAQGYPEHACP